MSSVDTNSHHSSDMVADQPGFSLSFYALFVALIFGMSFRLTFSDEKVKAEIEKAASKIHPELTFQVQSAQVSLSDGFLPEVAIVVQGIATESSKRCWGSPKIELDELKLPLSFSQLLSGRFNFDRVLLGQLRIELREKPEGPCSQTGASQLQNFSQMARAVASEQSPSRNPSQNPTSAEVTDRGLIETVQIQRLQLIYVPLSDAEIEFRRVLLDIQSHAPQQIKIQSQVNFTGSVLAGELSSMANLEMLYSESKSLSLLLNGAWREGSYKIQSSYQMDSKQVNVSGKVDHLPLSSFSALLQKYGLISWSLKGIQSWATFSLEYQSQDQNKGRLQLKDLLLDGDLGEVRLGEMNLDLGRKKISPVEVQVSGLSLDRLISGLSESVQKSSYFGKLGIFNGLVKMNSADDFEVIGDHSGLEFTFSNRGRRSVQVISAMSGFARKNEDGWFLEVNRVRPQEGVFEGRLRAKADSDLEKVMLDVKVDELVLSPAVQELMTSGGMVQQIESQMNVDIQKGKLKTLQGDFVLRGLSTEGLAVDTLQLSFLPVPEGFQARARARELQVQKESFLGEVIKARFSERAIRQDLAFLDGRAQLRSQNFSDLSWEGLSLKGPQMALQSQGKWSSEGQLQGSIRFENTLRGRQKEQLKFTLSGSREFPVFSDEETQAKD